MKILIFYIFLIFFINLSKTLDLINNNKSTNLDLLKNNNNKTVIGNNSDIIYNFSNNLLWKPNLIPNKDDNIIIESGFNILLNSSTFIKSLKLNNNSVLLIQDNLRIVDRLVSEKGSTLILDSENIDKGTMVIGSDVNLNGKIYINSYSSIYTRGKIYFINGELHIGGLYYINSKTLFKESTQYGLYGSMSIFTNDTEFNNNLMFLDTSLIDFLGSECNYLMSNQSLSTLIHSVVNILQTSFKMVDSGLVLNESLQIIDRSNITMTEGSMISAKNSRLQIVGSQLIKNNSTIVLEHDSNAIMIGTDLKFYNNSSMLLYNGSIVELTNGQLVLFDSYVDIFNDSELVIHGEGDNFKIFNQSAVEISHLGRCFIYGQLNLFDESSIKCKKGSDLYINGTLIHYQDSFINSTLASIYLNGDVFLKDKSFFQSTSSNVLINGNLSLENQTALKIKNSTFIVPGSIYLKSSIILKNSFLLIKGSFIANNEYSSNFTNSVLNITGEIYLNGALSFNNTYIQTNSNFSIQGDIIGNSLNVSTSFGHFIVGKNASFLCNNCNIDIGNDGEFIYDQYSVIKLNQTIIKIKPHGIMKSFGIIKVINGSSIVNTGKFEQHSSLIYYDQNSTIESSSSSIKNIGKWNCLNLNNQSSSSSSYIDLPFFNSGGDLIIDGLKTEFKFFNQDQGGNIQISNQGSLESKVPIILNNGGLYGNGTINGHVNSTEGDIGQYYSMNQLNINGNLHFNSNKSKIIITILNDKSFSTININQSLILNQQGGGELIFLINENWLENGEFEFLKFESIINTFEPSFLLSDSSSSSSSSSNEFSFIKFKSFNPLSPSSSSSSSSPNNDNSNENTNVINGCNASIKRKHGSMSLLLSGCVGSKKSVPVYTYVFMSVGIVCVCVIVSVGIQKRHFIKTRYLVWKDRSRESKYNSSNNIKYNR